ncbi:MAG TPA: RNA-binding protein [Thermoanaerobaculia bacterium]|jgi:RNA recognition motif-containing protein|nr:RNA-binding protein [Thermoanaerobaculia bacterium]
MKVYFGNLPKDIDDAKLGEIVKPYGTATTAEVVKDRVTGTSKGFAFVEFANDDEARATITALDGKDMNGQAVVVNEAKSRKEAPKAAASA